MSEKQKKEILENLDRQTPTLSEEHKQFILGYMEGVTQRPEELRKERETE